MIIRKVWEAKKSGTKYITVPKKSGIEIGDYVMILKIQYTNKLQNTEKEVNCIPKEPEQIKYNKKV